MKQNNKPFKKSLEGKNKAEDWIIMISDEIG